LSARRGGYPAAVPDANPFAQPDPAQTVVADHGWKVMLLNDDVTPFDVVVMGLQKACGLSEEVAEMVAVEAHTEGSAAAKRGLGQDEAEAICLRLKACTRIPRICPGVGCTAEQDD
jgi:ATP-dependent Clp protease adapter protein ClpS